MITLPRASEQKRVIAALKEANEVSGEGFECRLGLHIDDDDISTLFQEGEWGQSDTPITLDATISANLPRRLEDAPVRLVAEVAGVPIYQLKGKKTAFFPSDSPYRTEMLSSSAGSLAGGKDAIKLGEFTEYPGARPEQVVYDIARRLPYDLSLLDIQPIKGVILNWLGATTTPGFHAFEPTGDVLSRLAAQQTVGYLYRDTARGGMKASVPEPLASGDQGVPEGSFRTYSAAILPGWLTQRPHPPQERFSAVRVYHLDEKGALAWEVIEKVDYPPNVRLPDKMRTLEVPFIDEGSGDPQLGRVQAVQLSTELARNLYSSDDLTLPTFDPLIETFDPFWVSETHRDLDGLWDLSWAMRCETYKHILGGAGNQGAGNLATVVSYSATLLVEDKIKTPTFIVPRRSSGLAGASPLEIPNYGIDGDDLYFNDPLAWATTSGDDLIFETPAPVTTDGDDIVVESTP